MLLRFSTYFSCFLLPFFHLLLSVLVSFFGYPGLSCTPFPLLLQFPFLPIFVLIILHQRCRPLPTLSFSSLFTPHHSILPALLHISVSPYFCFDLSSFFFHSLFCPHHFSVFFHFQLFLETIVGLDSVDDESRPEKSHLSGGAAGRLLFDFILFYTRNFHFILC